MDLDYWQVIQSLLALIVVLGMILLVTYLLKRFGGDRIMVKGGSEQQEKRLDVVEVKMIDAKRRLVLIKRDDVEHLLLLTPEREMVIESSIEASEKPDA